jgi:hypothetical protein
VRAAAAAAAGAGAFGFLSTPRRLSSSGSHCSARSQPAKLAACAVLYARCALGLLALLHHDVAAHVAFERQSLETGFSLDRCKG